MCPKRQKPIKVGQYNVNIVKMLQGIYKTTSKTNKPPKKGTTEEKCLARLSQQEQNFVDGCREFSRVGAISRMVHSIKKASLCISAGEMVGSTNQVHLKHSSLLHK